MRVRLAILRLAPAFLFALAAGCGADNYIGAYTFSRSDAFTFTQPFASNNSQTATGIITIKAGTASSYQITMTDSTSGATPCNLNANLAGENLILPAAQMCMVKDNKGNAVNYSLTQGSGSTVVSGGSKSVVVNLAFSFTGNNGSIAIVGTGTSVVTATPTPM